MKKIVILCSCLVAVLANVIAQGTPPPPPPAPPKVSDMPPPPPLPPLPPAAKVRTKKIEIIVDTDGKTKTTKKDADIKVGDTKIIVRRRTDKDGDSDVQVGDRKIIIRDKKGIGSDSLPSGKQEEKVVVIRKKVKKDGKTEEIIINPDAAESMANDLARQAIRIARESIDKALKSVDIRIDDAKDRRKRADGNPKLQGDIDGELRNLDMERSEMSHQLDKIGAEMDKIGIDMDKKGAEMDKLSVEMDKKAAEMDKISGKIDAAEAAAEAAEEVAEAAREAVEDAAEAVRDATEDISISISPEAKKHCNPKVKTRFLLFDFGINGLMQNGSLNLTGAASPLEMNYGKSLNYQLGVIRQRVPLEKSGTLNFMWGLGFEFNNLEFSKAVSLPKDVDAMPELTVSPTVSYGKNRLYTSWVTAPLLLNIETRPCKAKKSFRASAGVFGGLMLASLMDQCTSENNKSTKTENGYQLNKVKYGFQAQIGTGPINLVAQYVMSPMFKEGSGLPILNSFNLGVSIVPF